MSVEWIIASIVVIALLALIVTEPRGGGPGVE